MNALFFKRTAVLGSMIAATTFSVPQPAAADTASTAAMIAGAAAIVGALVYDQNNHPYYVRNNHRYYVTQQEAQYYRAHHRGTQRNAWVPEQEYPVSRNPYQYSQNQRGQQQQYGQNQRGQQQHGQNPHGNPPGH
jgi:hypothetical protein